MAARSSGVRAGPVGSPNLARPAASPNTTSPADTSAPAAASAGCDSSSRISLTRLRSPARSTLQRTVEGETGPALRPDSPCVPSLLPRRMRRPAERSWYDPPPTLRPSADSERSSFADVATEYRSSSDTPVRTETASAGTLSRTRSGDGPMDRNKCALRMPEFSAPGASKESAYAAPSTASLPSSPDTRASATNRRAVYMRCRVRRPLRAGAVVRRPREQPQQPQQKHDHQLDGLEAGT